LSVLQNGDATASGNAEPGEPALMVPWVAPIAGSEVSPPPEVAAPSDPPVTARRVHHPRNEASLKRLLGPELSQMVGEQTQTAALQFQSTPGDEGASAGAPVPEAIRQPGRGAGDSDLQQFVDDTGGTVIPQPEGSDWRAVASSLGVDTAPPPPPSRWRALMAWLSPDASRQTASESGQGLGSWRAAWARGHDDAPAPVPWALRLMPWIFFALVARAAWLWVRRSSPRR
jgi:hypothetical protein